MTVIHEEQRMGRFGTANIEGIVRLPLVVKDITRREINICNPFENEAYHIQEGCTRNIVLTSDNFIFEITPKGIKSYTEFNSYEEQTRLMIENHDEVYFNCVLAVLEGLTQDALKGSKTIIIEKNVRSPFIDYVHESAKN